MTERERSEPACGCFEAGFLRGEERRVVSRIFRTFECGGLMA